MHSILLLFRSLIPFHSVIPFYSIIVSPFCMYGVLYILTCFISLQIVSFINPNVFCCSYCPRVHIFYMYMSVFPILSALLRYSPLYCRNDLDCLLYHDPHLNCQYALYCLFPFIYIVCMSHIVYFNMTLHLYCLYVLD